MTSLNDLKSQALQAADDARRHLADAHSEKKLHQAQSELLGLLEEQQQELKELRRDLKRQKSGGGFPWGLVLLAGAGYALYRTNASVRDRVNGLLGQIDPGIKGNLSRAGDAVKDAVHDVSAGKSPADAVQRAAGEGKRAGEKAVDSAKDIARQTADDVKSSQKLGNA
ncbi:hypothetical protein [Deinococcus sp.]|uniref:hypothetical protein n=1 Tax=Deinococcus sp. TaxID=47478 RepID=UPI002869EB10|nr:hypothetical protein [Deinococcus sp.]